MSRLAETTAGNIRNAPDCARAKIRRVVNFETILYSYIYQGKRQALCANESV